MFKIIASFAAENIGKKAFDEVWIGQKLLYGMKRDAQKGKYLTN